MGRVRPLYYHRRSRKTDRCGEYTALAILIAEGEPDKARVVTCVSGAQPLTSKTEYAALRKGFSAA